MAKIICSDCKETFAELRNPEEAKAYLNEIKVENNEAFHDGLDSVYKCGVCNSEDLILEEAQTFGLKCDKCNKEENYFDSKFELGDQCKCGGTMLPCLVNV